MFSQKTMQDTTDVNSSSTIGSTRISTLGFMKGDRRVPDNFNTIGADIIEGLF